MSTTESFNLAKYNGLKDSNFLTWTGVRCAVPSHLKIRSREVNKNHVRSLQFKIGDKTFDPVLSKSGISTVCLYLVRRRSPESSQSWNLNYLLTMWKQKKAFSLKRTCICETYVQCFQFKILNDILFTNSRLAKIGLIQSDLCTFCNIGVETKVLLFSLPIKN